MWAGYSILLSNRSKLITIGKKTIRQIQQMKFNTNIDPSLLRSKVWLAQSTRIRQIQGLTGKYMKNTFSW